MSKCRITDITGKIGILPPGINNSITDVFGVEVGQTTLIEGMDVRTGVTVIKPHGNSIFQEKVPAGLWVGNGYGKLTGSTQLTELGEIETPIVLTNTFAVPAAMQALIEYTLEQNPGIEVNSINPVVGETNDGTLNNIRKFSVTKEVVLSTLLNTSTVPPEEGAVGAGTGTIAFGWKGGIGNSSRKLPDILGGYTVGVLVQTNFGGVLQINGIPVGKNVGQYYLKDSLDESVDGSVMIVLATDAPLSDRNLGRLAKRSMAGLARTGAAFSNGSGDYAIAFSTADSVRRTIARRSTTYKYSEISNDQVSPLFLAAIEATEEAIYNSMSMAQTMVGYKGTIGCLPLDKIRPLFQPMLKNSDKE